MICLLSDQANRDFHEIGVFATHGMLGIRLGDIASAGPSVQSAGD